MRDKLNQFIDNLNGQFVEVSDRTNVNQCMDLAYNWVFALGFPKATIQALYAYQVFTAPKEITRQYFEIIPNSSAFIPQDGDIGVFDKTTGNIAGHIVICLGGGSTTSFKAFSQNSPIGTNCSVRDFKYTNFLGVLRPKLPEQLDEFKWFKGLLAENQIFPEDAESRIREMFDKAKKYDSQSKELAKAILDLGSVNGRATELEENLIAARRANKKLEDDLNTAKESLTERDTTINALRIQLAECGQPVEPEPIPNFLVRLIKWLFRK